jgi:tellurite resistance protein TerC
MLSPSGTLSGFSNIRQDGHTGIPAPLHAAERKSKIRAEETGDHSSFSSRGLLPESLMILRTVEQVRRFSRIIGGFTLLLIGIVMLVTPGPGWLVIFLGLGLLAAEFVWAKRLMDRIKHEGGRVRDAVWRTTKNAPTKDSPESNETAET